MKKIVINVSGLIISMTITGLNVIFVQTVYILLHNSPLQIFLKMDTWMFFCSQLLGDIEVYRHRKKRHDSSSVNKELNEKMDEICSMAMGEEVEYQEFQRVAPRGNARRKKVKHQQHE